MHLAMFRQCRHELIAFNRLKIRRCEVSITNKTFTVVALSLHDSRWDDVRVFDVYRKPVVAGDPRLKTITFIRRTVVIEGIGCKKIPSYKLNAHLNNYVRSGQYSVVISYTCNLEIVSQDAMLHAVQQLTCYVIPNFAEELTTLKRNH